MAVSEESRHRLYQRLEEVLGHGEATTLMEHLPPVGWADVATKRDLDVLEERLGQRIATLEVRLDHVDYRFDQIDYRFDQIDRRFDQIDRRFEKIDGRLDRFEGRFDRLRSDLRSYSLAVMTLMIAVAGAIVAAVKI